MPKKKPVKSALASAVIASAIVPEKAIRPRDVKKRGGGKGSSRGGTVGGKCNPMVTIHHPEGTNPHNGEMERRALLKWRAMELKINGLNTRQIGLQLQEDFELVNSPALSTIDDWLDEAFAEVMSAKQMQADRHCSLILARNESMIANLLPIALGRTIIRRTRIRDGQEFAILDERAVGEMVSASGEVRKLMDQTARLFKLGRAEGEDADGKPITGQAILQIVEQTVNNHIHFPGQVPKAPVTLVLESGDADIDALDARALQEAMAPEPI